MIGFLKDVFFGDEPQRPHPPECPHCGKSMGGGTPIAIPESNASLAGDFISGCRVVDGELVTPSFQICQTCEERIYFKGARELYEVQEA